MGRATAINGLDVGRTYADGTPVGPRGYWSIYGINLRGPVSAGVVLQGLVDDLTGAKAAFRENWEKLLGAGTVKASIRRKPGEVYPCLVNQREPRTAK